MSSKKIFVGGLPKRYTKVEFEEYFKTHGEIDQIKLIYVT
jgi:RNA recognition motif-containing protein